MLGHGRCFAKLPRDRPTAEKLAEAFVTTAPPAPTPATPSLVLELPRSTSQDEELQKLRKDLKDAEDKHQALRRCKRSHACACLRMTDQQDLTEEVVRVNSRLMQKISQLKQENDDDDDLLLFLQKQKWYMAAIYLFGLGICH